MFSGVFAGKKVLITGDTGFKGSWLATWLLNLGAEVYGFALAPKTPDDNFVVCGLGSKIQHRDGDIQDFGAFSEFCREVSPEFVFHLAAQSLVFESYLNPRQTFGVNVLGTVNVLEAIRQTPSVRAVVNVTSDKCYENREWVWEYRETDALGSNDPYSASKAASELVTGAYIKAFTSPTGSLQIATGRAGNVIGGGDWAQNRVVPDFFRAMAAREPLVLRHPEATRPWQFVLEPLSGYLHLAAQLVNAGSTVAGAWNFGPLRQTAETVHSLVRRIAAQVGEGACEVRCESSPYHEAGLLGVDISKALHHLKWRPVLAFDDTVRMTVDGYLVESASDVYAARVHQIHQYSAKAKNQLLPWTE